MFRRSLAIAVMLGVALTLGATAAPVTAAQLSPEELLLQVDGLESAYARKYIADSDLGFATPVVSDASTPSVMLVTVLGFQTEKQATDAFETRINGLVARVLLGEPDMDVEETEIDDLGDGALLYTGVVESIDGPEHQALLAVQDGNLGFLIEASGADASMVETVKGIAAFMVEAEPGDEPVEVDEFGATGGTFEIMPTLADGDVLHGLIPMYDYDLLLNGGEEPLSHLHGNEATPQS